MTSISKWLLLVSLICFTWTSTTLSLPQNLQHKTVFIVCGTILWTDMHSFYEAVLKEIISTKFTTEHYAWNNAISIAFFFFSFLFLSNKNTQQEVQAPGINWTQVLREDKTIFITQPSDPNNQTTFTNRDQLNEYCQTSSITHTKSQNSNVSHLDLQLSLANPLKPGVKSRMKM